MCTSCVRHFVWSLAYPRVCSVCWALRMETPLLSASTGCCVFEACLDLGEESLPSFMALPDLTCLPCPNPCCVPLLSQLVALCGMQNPFRVLWKWVIYPHSSLNKYFTGCFWKLSLCYEQKKEEWRSFCFLRATVVSCRCTREMRPHSKSQAFKSTRTIAFASVCAAGAQIPHRNLVDLSAHPLPSCFSKMRSCSREKWEA